MENRLHKAVLTVVFIGAVLLFGGCGMLSKEETIRPDLIEEQNKVERKKSYQMTEIKRGTVSFNSEIMCKAVCDEEKSLKFGVSGVEYGMVYVDVGDKVKKGDLLAELSMEGIDEEIDSAKLEYELARMEYSHYDTQIADAVNIGHLSDMSSAEVNEQVKGLKDSKADCGATLHLAQVRYEEAQDEKKKRQLFAPMDGIITNLLDTSPVVSEGGESVSPVSSTSVEFIKMSSGNYHFQAETEDYADYKVGDVVGVIVNKQEYKMKLRKSEEVEGKDAHLLTFDLMESGFRIQANSTGILKTPVTKLDDVLYVEREAVVTLNKKQYVYFVNEDNVRSLKEVTVGMSNDDYTVIEEGVSEGQKVMLKEVAVKSDD